MLSRRLHDFLYHNEDVKKKTVSGKIIVPKDRWHDFLHDMGMALGFYITESSSEDN